MSKVFDYIFYRVNKAYFKWDGRNGNTAQIAVSMVQSMLIGEVITLALGFMLSKQQLASISKTFIFGWSITFIGLIIYNSYKYKNRYNTLKGYWKDETKKQSIARGLLVIIVLVLPWAIIFLMISKRN